MILSLKHIFFRLDGSLACCTKYG